MARTIEKVGNTVEVTWTGSTTRKKVFTLADIRARKAAATEAKEQATADETKWQNADDEAVSLGLTL